MKLACPSHQRTMSASRAPPNFFSGVLLNCLLESQKSEKPCKKKKYSVEPRTVERSAHFLRETPCPWTMLKNTRHTF